MRLDMGKCVIERPRYGSRTATSAKARGYGKIVHDDDGPDYEGLTRLPASPKQEGYLKKLGDKNFSDLLGPIRRFLRTNCGRVWDDVYSEIARVLGRSGSWGVRHILTAHVDVAVHTYRDVDGCVWVCDRQGVHKAGFYREFYVEPETGILREAPHRKWRWRGPSTPHDVVPIEEGKVYRKAEGIWYYHEFAVVEKQVITKVKRQLGKKDLKRLGLRNG